MKRARIFRRRSVGNLVITGSIVTNVVLYAVAVRNAGGAYSTQLLAEVMSSSAMILLSWSLILSNRFRFLEPFFGGLDKMYKSHKTSGTTALVLLFAHFFTIPDLSAPDSAGRTLGKAALIGLTSLVALALAPRLPIVGGYLRLAYHHWKFTHRFIGLFFIIGFIHMLVVSDLTSTLPLARWYWNSIVFAGIAAYVFNEVISRLFFRRALPYVVESVTRPNASMIEVGMRPTGKSRAHQAGQFAYVAFPGDRRLSEPHPFTISSGSSDDLLRMSIKASGDWTKRLYRTLEAGSSATIDGCYGRFSYTQGGGRQIWIAGGIGITPFLSWIRDLPIQSQSQDLDIDLFYSVRAGVEAPHWREIRTAARKRPWLRASLNVSSLDGQLDLDQIAADHGDDLASSHVYLCGPLSMVEACGARFKRLGVPAANIYSEEFNLR